MVNRTRYRNELGQIDAVGQYVSFPASWLVSYYKLDETTGTSVADSFGSNTGTASNVTWTAGKINNAGSFNGSSSKINLWQSFPVVNRNGDRTYAAWIYIDTTNTYKMIFSYDKWTSWDARYWWDFFYVTNTWAIRVEYVQKNHYGTWRTSVPTLSSWQWYHIVWVKVWGDATNRKIYINWVWVATTDVVHTYDPSANAVGTGNAAIWFRYGASDSFMDWLIDEVGIWDRALTQDEITQLYNGGNGRTLV